MIIYDVLYHIKHITINVFYAIMKFRNKVFLREVSARDVRLYMGEFNEYY